MKCLNPLNNIFHCVANGEGGLGDVWGGCVTKCAPEPNVAVNLIKCLNPLNIIFFQCLTDER